MLNKNGERELAYVVLVDEIEELPGYDRVESARIGGWWCIVPKGQFHVGDPGIYFEIDSRVPSDNPAFAFLEKRNYKIKTQKMCKSISQGLLMHAEDFSWKAMPAVLGVEDDTDAFACIIDDKGKQHFVNDESRFLTKKLGVTYADAEDNQRKAPSVDKYKKMAQRNPNVFKKPWARWMMKRNWGRKVMFFLFGKKKDKKNGWPEWVQKTDEERVQNMPWVLNDTGEWVITEKIDGSSTTFTMKRGKRGKNEFYVCSRNVCFDSIDKPCYYDTNIYWEMAQKYDMYNILANLLKKIPDAEWITIQGETFGADIQKRDYSLEGHDFRAFNLITSNKGRWGTLAMKSLLEDGFSIPCVPILEESFTFDKLDSIIEDRMEAILKLAERKPSVIDGKPREGLVLRSIDGVKSFKAVSNAFLLKYHS